MAIPLLMFVELMPWENREWRSLQRSLQGTVVALTVGFLAGCTPSPPQNSAPSAVPSASPASLGPKVVATTSVLCDLAKQVAQTTVNLTCLVQAGEDPHTYTPKPEDRRAIDDAALVLYAGYDFEPSLVKLIKASPSQAAKIAVHEVAVPKPLLAEGEHDHDHGGEPTKADAKTAESEKAGGEEKVPDPHVWHNAQNGVRMVEVIQGQLEKVAPANAALYAKNTQAIRDRLTQLDRWIKAQIATIPTATRTLITTHDALGYYSAAYGIPIEGALQGLSTEEEPTAGRLKELVDEIRTTGVPTVFAEVTANPKLITAVAKEAKVKVSEQELYADGLGAPGSKGDTYEKMLMANTQAIVEGLGGKFVPFSAP